MFMYYCGQKGSKFGELKWSQTAAKVLRSRENHVENKNFLGGGMPPNPPTNARGTCLRHVQGDHFWYYIIFLFFLCYSVSCLIYYVCNNLVALLKPAQYVRIKKYIIIIVLLCTGEE